MHKIDIFLRLYAVDELNGISVMLSENVYQCYGCSNHGSCNYSIATATSISTFFIAPCSCDIGWTGRTLILFLSFSSPEPKAQVSFSDHNLSVDIVGCVVQKNINKILKIFFKTIRLISTKVGTKHDLVKMIQVKAEDYP